MKKILILPALLLFMSCATSVSTKFASQSYPILNEQEPIFILDENETIPANSLFVGDIKIGDTGFTTDCGYNKVLEDATAIARKSGANIIKTVKLKNPSLFGSTCYRLTAKIYRNLDTVSLADITEQRKLKNKSRLPVDSDYALVHFYRPPIAIGSLLGYNIKNGNDSIVGNLRNGRKFTLKIKDFGDQSFYAVLETKEEIKIKVEKGQEYFVRCGMNTGIVIARPEMNIIENYLGMKEFEELK